MNPDNYTQAKTREEMATIGKDAAIALFETKWWEGKTPRQIAGFCLSVQELCCPFDVFHEAVEKSFGRPVWTHEFGMNFQGILDEFNGAAAAPTMQEIIEQIPEEKRVVLVVE